MVGDQVIMVTSSAMLIIFLIDHKRQCHLKTKRTRAMRNCKVGLDNLYLHRADEEVRSGDSIQ